MRRLLAWIESQPAQRMLVACIGVVVLIGVADIMTGSQYFLTAPYIVPISIAAWRTGWKRAVFVALIAISALLLADISDPLSDVSIVALLWNQVARFMVFTFIIVLISSLRDARHHAEVMARTDVLTGIANLFAFREASDRELDRARREGQPLTLLFLDIDDFKIVNDFHGHSSGDEVLRRIARALCYAVRRDDFVARVGGDEFVVLLPRTDANGAAHVIDRVTNRLAAISRPDGTPLTCTIGSATHNPAPTTIDEMLQEADQAMYQVKAQRAEPDRGAAMHGVRSLRLLAPVPDSSDDAQAVGTDF